MSMLTVQINTDDIYEKGLENAIMDAIVEKITIDFNNKAESFLSEKTSALMVAAIDRAVEVKLKNLMNEPVVITDRWGSKKFLGTAEDYIKNEIDSKILRPVDSTGKTLAGCAHSDAKTWLEWTIEKTNDDLIKRSLNEFKSKAETSLNQMVKVAMSDIVTDATKRQIGAAISSVITGK